MVTVKTALLLFLLIFAAVAAATAQENLKIASVDKDLQRKTAKPVPAPVVTEKYEYYEVKGGSEAELRCDMNSNSCRWDDGKKYDSVTTWHIKWDYDYERTAQSCSATTFKATVDVTFRYPKWARADGAPLPLAAKWDSYMKKLTEHENGHRDLAVRAAAELSRSVADLPPSSSCAELDRQVRELCRVRMKKLNDDEKAYDTITHHGLTQGAIFP
jgi:predicted secreted Zn-dependent protease